MPPRSPEKRYSGTHEFWIKPKYFFLIQSGRKTKEVRLATENPVQTGDLVIFKTTSKNKTLFCKKIITGVKIYTGLKTMVNQEDMTLILPETNSNDYEELAKTTFPKINLETARFEVWDLQNPERK